jgi:adenylosuccinate synthase
MAGTIPVGSTAVVGSQWGDEGKGKIVDALASSFDYVVRFQGGANAGHTINNEFGRFALHLLPSGVFYPNVINILGPGTAIHIPTFLKEVEDLRARGIPDPKLFISDRAQIVLDAHILLDRFREESSTGRTFGSTKSGIAPFYSAKYAKKGIRIGEILHSHDLSAEVAAALEEPNIFFTHHYNKPSLDVEEETNKLLQYKSAIAPFLIDSSITLKEALKAGKKILVEGQLGALRDPDHGVYPFSTSSSTLAGFATIGAGVPPHALTRVIAVTKAYSSKVGSGPFVVEMQDAESANQLRMLGGDKGEFGATTGRPRDVGWFDAVATRYGIMVQGATEIALTNLDVLGHFPTIPICTAYSIKGVPTTTFPLNSLLERATPVFEELPGWNVPKEELAKIRHFTDLPKNAQQYVLRIEELCECSIKLVSIGPDRSQLLWR